MIPNRDKKILAEHSSEELEGRAEEAERLYLAAVSGGGASHIRVKGAPNAGLSELLRQTYDRLFSEQRFVVPFYFSLRREDLTARDAAIRFAYEFLLQSVAFRRKEPQLLKASPDICELQKLAPLPDAQWVNAISETCDSDSALNDVNAFVRTALAAPFRAAVSGGFRVSVIADDLHNAVSIDGGQTFLAWLSSFSAPGGSSLLLAGRRNASVPGKDASVINVDRPSVRDAGSIAAQLAREAQVDISESVRDLIVTATDRRPAYIRSIVSAARDSRSNLTTYRDIARIYSAEVVEGRIADVLRNEIGRTAGIVEALAAATNSSFKLTALSERLDLDGEQFKQLLAQLTSAEILEVHGETAVVAADRILGQYLTAETEVLAGRATPVAMAARIGSSFLQNSPTAMAREYRRAASIGLADLLSAFDGRDVPRAFIDYRTFRDSYKGLSDGEIRAKIADDGETFTLPQVVRAAELVQFAPAFESDIEPERVAAGVGFAGRSYRAEDEITWIAAEIDSKLEADPDVVREWIERLDNAARDAGFARHRIWLVAPEGFSAGAIELLAERGDVCSSRRQVELLKAIIEGEKKEASSSDYEMVIPIGDDTELIAVHAVEEVARRSSFPAKSINQIKTALVEACINAAEHSLSPDGKIHLKFSSFADRLVLTVSNRGLRLADKARDAAAEPASDTRRGWGLGLMRNLMDEVRVEAVDDGTRIVMTKLLRSA